MYLGDPRDVRRYMALSQIGLEMVAPIVLGLVLDHFLGWSPWGVIVGVVVGLTGSFVHLTAVLSKEDKDSSPPGANQRETR